MGKNDPQKDSMLKKKTNEELTEENQIQTIFMKMNWEKLAKMKNANLKKMK
jgi:hypothetical protein